MGGEGVVADGTGMGADCAATDEEGSAHPQPEPYGHGRWSSSEKREIDVKGK